MSSKGNILESEKERVRKRERERASLKYSQVAVAGDISMERR